MERERSTSSVVLAAGPAISLPSVCDTGMETGMETGAEIGVETGAVKRVVLRPCGMQYGYAAIRLCSNTAMQYTVQHTVKSFPDPHAIAIQLSDNQ